jgi:hypothetical protein
VPCSAQSIVCGDFNARLGNQSPEIGGTYLPRTSKDSVTCARAPWVLEVCESGRWHILNGAQPGPPADYTFRRGDSASCVDLMLSKDCQPRVSIDDTTLCGFSDHVLLTTCISTPHLRASRAEGGKGSTNRVIYKWVEGNVV